MPARDRPGLERLIRYMARPRLASERVEMLPDGRLVYEFKRPWRDGTSRVICTPLEFVEKLLPLVPKPRVHLTRYSGVLGPAAKWRPAIIPPAAGLETQPAAIMASSLDRAYENPSGNRGVFCFHGKIRAALVSELFAAILGPASIPIWLTLATLLGSLRALLLINQERLKKNGGTSMKKTNQRLNIVSFSLTGFAETVWDIGTKITAA